MIRPVMIRVELPAHLRTLAGVSGEVRLDIAADGLDVVTIGDALDALEARYPVLRGTIRDHRTGRRRAFVRFFACKEDLSHEAADHPLPEAVVTGSEPLLVVGAMAGG
jgi:molybdopterin synthase sulfur carrier subunit